MSFFVPVMVRGFNQQYASGLSSRVGLIVYLVFCLVYLAVVCALALALLAILLFPKYFERWKSLIERWERLGLRR